MRATDRRKFLKVLGAASAFSLAGAPLLRALAKPTNAKDEFFVFIYMAGGWDVMLWSDPRNTRQGLVNPPSTSNLRTTGLKHWTNAPLGGGETSFQIVQPAGSNIAFGPAIGDLINHYDRLCVVNGIAMNTVSHPDGTVYSATGQHLVGSRAVSPSIDTIIANELGLAQLFPLVSVRFPSYFIGSNLDRRATPVLVDKIGAVGKSLTRTSQFDSAAARDAVTQMLVQEANDLAARAYYPDTYEGMALQYESLRKMLEGDVRDAFIASSLQAAQPSFDYAGKYHGDEALGAAFAVEAFKRDIVRCASFTLGGFDTHIGNYQNHALMLQEAFDMIADLVDVLDATPHPFISGNTLSDHTHIFVMSEFCRGPMLNAAGGRDHYPNNSALVISPRFKGNFVHGQSDMEQLLPDSNVSTPEGDRPIGPADVLATFLSAFDIDPAAYLRDGVAIPELLVP